MIGAGKLAIVAFGLWATGAQAEPEGDPDRPAPRRPSGLVHRSQRAGGDAGPAGFLGADATPPGYGDHGAASARATAACCGRGAGAGRSVARRRSPGDRPDNNAGSDSTWVDRTVTRACRRWAARRRRTAHRSRSRVHADAEPGRGPAAATTKSPSEPRAARRRRGRAAGSRRAGDSRRRAGDGRRRAGDGRRSTGDSRRRAGDSGACASAPAPRLELALRTHVGDRRAVGAHPAGTRRRFAGCSHVHARHRTARSRCASRQRRASEVAGR